MTESRIDAVETQGDEGRNFQESPSCIEGKRLLVSYHWPRATLKRDAASHAVAPRHLLRLHLATLAMTTPESSPLPPPTKREKGEVVADGANGHQPVLSNERLCHRL